MNQSATLYEILVVRNSASKKQIKKHYQKMSLLTHPDAGVDEEFFMTINGAFQILTNDAAREAYILNLKGKKVRNEEFDESLKKFLC